MPGFYVPCTSGRLVVGWYTVWDLVIGRFESVTDDADKGGRVMISWRAVEGLGKGCSEISGSFLRLSGKFTILSDFLFSFCDFASFISQNTLSLACGFANSVSNCSSFSAALRACFLPSIDFSAISSAIFAVSSCNWADDEELVSNEVGRESFV